MLKQLIQRLLDSRTTPAQAGHASKPGSAVPVDYNPSASVDNWGPVLSNSTAVSDGYIWAVGRTTSDKGFFQINTQALQITTTGTSNPGGEILNLFTPVSKGQRFSVYGRYLEQITVRLVKTIGRGYNIFVRRVLSCLKPSFNFSPKVFSKASILTLLTNVGRVQQYRTKTFREEVNKISLPHLVVGPCFRLEGLMTSPISGSDLKTPQERLAISLTSLVGGNGPRSRYRRVTQSLRILASTRVRGTLLLFATNRLNNLQTGGALC